MQQTKQEFIDNIEQELGYNIGLDTSEEVVDCTADNDYIVIQARRIKRIRQMELTKDQAIRALRLFRTEVNIYFVPTISDLWLARNYLRDFGFIDFNYDDEMSTDRLIEAQNALSSWIEFLTPGAYHFLEQYLERTIYRRQTGYALGQRVCGEELTDADNWLTNMSQVILKLDDYRNMSLEQRELMHRYIATDNESLTPNMQQYLHDKIEQE